MASSSSTIQLHDRASIRKANIKNAKEKYLTKFMQILPEIQTSEKAEELKDKIKEEINTYLEYQIEVETESGYEFGTQPIDIDKLYLVNIPK
ncbi:7852_t:CDS:2 [Dentiscutata heterogama]|uniref:7852_t:CDS:1 n=1 Tax=Dentiscutata heterogama TaxID=1316150 RepID=A0ACA9KK17_9GLOM|nr:7852_t:CDS:2 [Dentiscutata heterogama]